ncbi:MAG: hypothetical protein QM768_08070 [Agriterribacter sp.]
MNDRIRCVAAPLRTLQEKEKISRSDAEGQRKEERIENNDKPLRRNFVASAARNKKANL